MVPHLRPLVVLLVAGLVVAGAADAAVRAPGFFMPRDFIEYWAAGRVNLRGGNPYHPDELRTEQRRVDPAHTDVVMMWNPPPALALYMPLGLPPARWAALLWTGLQLAAVFAACDLLWRTYCPARRWCAAAVAATFVGTWWLVAFGQNTGLMLLGLAGFLYYTRADRPRTAGAFAALTALKPHLLAVFGVLLVADAVTRRGRTALATGAAALALALGAALAANPAVVAQFVDAARHPAPGATPLSYWELPVPAYWLRTWAAPGHFWVQFVPCGLACAGALAYRLRPGRAWDWARALPPAVAVAVLTTPYGGWVFDLPVLLVPVVAAAGTLVATGRGALALAFVGAQAALAAATVAVPIVLQSTVRLYEYWWVAPAALALCLPAVRRAAGSPDRTRS